MNPVNDGSLEFEIRERKYRRIGWAIVHMKWYQKIWWMFGGVPEYMSTKYWKECDD